MKYIKCLNDLKGWYLCREFRFNILSYQFWICNIRFCSMKCLKEHYKEVHKK